MIKKLFNCLFYLLISPNIVFIAAHSYAENIYQYKDTVTGSTLLTNKKHQQRTLTRVKVTYYPDSNIHHYQNWGKSEASVLPSFHGNKNAFDAIIQQAAQQHKIAEGLIKAVMHTESGFNIYARSPVGAQGLMQLMPATAKRFNVTQPYDPYQNIMAGAQYLSWLLRRFNGNIPLALAGYNAGEGNVSKYGGIPPFKETQDYVQRVMSRFKNLYSQTDLSSFSSQSALPALNLASKIVYQQSAQRDPSIRTYATQHATASASITVLD
ncbi:MULTISPECIES: lytic transglycosylase domain-containing protein [unclassified Acinetobacter]|uniref:lytic transglycosylase domain-containing protein n=1 Tax=unclassified Acinetobacter TaxID=196816 RepID=UPI002934F264|nr:MULTISPECIES: lytic transglycosylase domain-containing protein [unclassified Acinetobacter]WOE31481.1 lytic transglycosylase domain-containing protein [Acinetobacter sp. SAAs470]WOE39677.1 lytic transglycosylase domain-containing protein [Acinetobacter sp. SAAs474]